MFILSVSVVKMVDEDEDEDGGLEYECDFCVEVLCGGE